MPPHRGSSGSCSGAGGPGPGPGASASQEDEESIYNLLPKIQVAQPKPPLYRSPRLRHAARQPPVASTIGAFGGPHLLGQARLERRPWAHWGPAGSQAADPKRFLRRGEGQGGLLLNANAKAKARPSSSGPAEPTTTATAPEMLPPRKPPVPSHAVGDSKKGPRVEWDFIYANAMDAITAVRFDLLFRSRVDLIIN